jgi:two-component system sensor histidine kinase KdpD
MSLSAEGRAKPALRTQGGHRAKPYLASVAMVALATALGYAIERVVALPNVSLIFVAAILVSAWRYGWWPAVAAALLSTASYNWFFIPPLYTWEIADPANVVALAFFLAVAALMSAVAARAREQALAVARHARTTEALHTFSGKLAAVAELDDLLWATAHQLAVMLQVDVVLLLRQGGRLAVRAGFPPVDRLDAYALDAAMECWSADSWPVAADPLPAHRWLFRVLKTERDRIGVVGIRRGHGVNALSAAEWRLLDALADQAAVAIERIQLVRDVEAERLRAEGDRWRAALLASVSHDLKTPLASIIGALSSLRSYGARFDEETRGELLSTALEEAERLNRFVANLLDMTRLDAGAVAPKRASVDAGELIGAAVRRAQRLLARHRVELDIASDLPPLSLDFVLMEQALFNVLDNAAKYAPEGTTVTVSAAREGEGVAITVSDEGSGIPEAELERIFDKFHRVRNADRQRAGTGLGLAIARGFVATQGGTLTAENRRDRSGTRFAFHLPL